MLAQKKASEENKKNELDKKLALIPLETDLEKAKTFIKNVQEFIKIYRNEFDIIKISEFFIVTKEVLNGNINQEIKDIRQLLVMSELSEKALADNIYQIKIEQQHTKLKPQQVKEWASIAGKKVMKVWNFKLSVSAKDAVDKGLKGKDIGDYIKKRETELFK